MGAFAAICFVGQYAIRKIKKYARKISNELKKLMVCRGPTIDATHLTCRLQAVLAFDDRFMEIAKDTKVRILPQSTMTNELTLSDS